MTTFDFDDGIVIVHIECVSETDTHECDDAVSDDHDYARVLQPVEVTFRRNHKTFTHNFPAIFRRFSADFQLNLRTTCTNCAQF